MVLEFKVIPIVFVWNFPRFPCKFVYSCVKAHAFVTRVLEWGLIAFFLLFTWYFGGMELWIIWNSVLIFCIKTDFLMIFVLFSLWRLEVGWELEILVCYACSEWAFEKVLMVVIYAGFYTFSVIKLCLDNLVLSCGISCFKNSLFVRFQVFSLHFSNFFVLAANLSFKPCVTNSSGL